MQHPQDTDIVPMHWSRRQWLGSLAGGFPLLALGGILAAEEERASDPLAPRVGHHEARARRAIFLFMGGGPSHVDLFDPKPLLAQHRQFPLPLPRITRDASRNCQPSPFRFAQHGRSGAWMSELLPNLATMADELCIIRSCYCDNIEHGAALRQMMTGDAAMARPSIGSWLLYGLGTESQNLPGFVFIGGQGNLSGDALYSSSFLPATFQGTRVTDLRQPISNLQARTPPQEQCHLVTTIRQLNEAHRRGREHDSRLNARIAALELAFRMQTEAPEVFDLSRETELTRALYGIGDARTDDYGRKCLLARRLVERGVRFVVANVDNKWDAHGNVRDHERTAAETDRPVAGLLRDLKARGLLEDTLVIWGGEFGRTPTGQGNGRDHHPYGFTMWLAGAGVKPGVTYGATDDFGFHAVENKVHVHDLHATVLHLMGLDHERLTYRYSGRDFRLTDVAGEVVRGVLA